MTGKLGRAWVGVWVVHGVMHGVVHGFSINDVVYYLDGGVVGLSIGVGYTDPCTAQLARHPKPKSDPS